MMKSKELRVKAWDSLKGKYWKAFFAAIIAGIIYSIGAAVISYGQQILEIPGAVDPSQMDYDLKIGALVVTGIGTFVWLIGFIIKTFIGNPALVGCCNYFIENTDSKPALSEIFSAYKTKYGRNVGTILLSDIKLVLWTLLFIIPGVIKSFEYSIIPYILADDAEISSKDAFKKAKELMKGNKWRLFKLDFSFIGWYLLSALTLGIGAFFVIPYVEAAIAEFYMEIKNK